MSKAAVLIQLLSFREMRRGMRKFLPEYKKVVFRAYNDKDFLLPVGRGEPQEHLGIMGPFIRAEINDLLTVSGAVAEQNRRTSNETVCNFLTFFRCLVTYRFPLCLI